MLRALDHNDGRWFVTTERRTHWKQAVRDVHSAETLERLMRAVLLHFNEAFASELFLEQHMHRFYTHLNDLQAIHAGRDRQDEEETVEYRDDDNEDE